MLHNYLMVVFRYLLRQKTYAWINVLGLGIGIACAMVAAAYVHYQLTWDQNHPDHIYRVLWLTPMEKRAIASTSGPVGAALKAEFPEVVEATRLWNQTVWVRVENETFQEALCVSDTSIFKTFNLPLTVGDFHKVLKDPYSIVITEATAVRYFGENNPVGQTITIEDRFSGGTYTVTGILKNLPENSSLTFQLLTNTRAQEGIQGRWDKWLREESWRPFSTFVRLRGEKDQARLVDKLPQFLVRHQGKETASLHAYALQPLTDIHLYGTSKFDGGSGGVIGSVYQIGGIGASILFIACLNFINLSTAYASARVREIGVRKVVGAKRTQLFIQFSFESIMLACLAGVVGVALADAAIPLFRTYASGAFSVHHASIAESWFILPVLILLVGLAAGTYPALVISSVEPVGALKPGGKIGPGDERFRKMLVFVQFSTTIILLVTTVVMRQQTQFMRSKKLGFEHDLVITMPLFDLDREREPDFAQHLSYRYESIKSAFLSHPNVLQASAYRWPPGINKGMIRLLESEEKQVQIPVLEGDEGFVELFDIPLVTGRNFRPYAGYTDVGELLINESAARLIGWSDPVGKPLNGRDFRRPSIVVGVVQDFHTERLSEPVGPLAIFYRIDVFRHLGVKIRPQRVEETIAFLQDTWMQFLPERPFEFAFLSEEIHDLYRTESETARVVGAFTFLALLVGCLGLFALCQFSAERRRKEIAIRKVLGAGTMRLVFCLAGESAFWVLAANIMTWPVAYLLMERWLQNFPYRMELDISIFALAGFVTLGVAQLTTCSQALQAIHANPANVLRSE